VKPKKSRLPLDSLGLGDLGRLWSNRPMRMALVGILVLPLVYSCIYLKAFFDPYANMKQLPVAIVNEDRGAVKDGEPVDVGGELVKELREDSKLKWEFVSRRRMMEGFRKGSYYVGIVIPADFSERAVSADSPRPLQGELQYYVDESNNYLAGKLGESIRRELEMSLQEKLAHAYAEAMFEEIGNSADELSKAVDGAEKLAGHVSKAEDGAGRMKQGLGKLEAGARKLRDGTRQLEDGLEQLHAGVKTARGKLDEPMSKVLKAKQVVHEVNDTIQRVARTPLPDDWIAGLKQRAASGDSALSRAGREHEAVRRELDELITRHPELAQDPTVEELRKSLVSAEEALRSGQGDIGSIAGRLEELEREGDRFLELRQVIARESQDLTNRFDRQVQELERMMKDADRLVDGTGRLLEGSRQLEAGQEQLMAGAIRLEAGASELKVGLGKIADGQAKLADGLSEGVDKARENLRGADQKADMMSDPVKMREHKLHKVPNYATGFAPYFISLSLWVGAMVLFTIVDLYRALELPDRPESGPLHLATGALIGSGQAVILSAVLVAALGLNPELPGWLCPFTILISLTFVAINQMLVALLGNVGRFVAIVLLMLQVTSSAGTYPLELLPDFFRELHPVLPMTYAVHGLRAVLSSGELDAVLQDGKILLGYMVAAYIVTRLFLDLGKPAVRKMASAVKTAKAA
jgi:putative membrane protein